MGWTYISIWWSCTEESHEIYFFQVDVQYPEELYEYWESWKLHDKKECAFNIRYIKQALNHGLILKKVIESLNVFKKPG